MARMFQFETRSYVDVPDEYMEQAYRSGEYGFARGSKVSVQLPGGQYGSINESELPRLFEYGGRIESDSQKTSRLEKEEYSDVGSSVAATALALGRGVTFGLSDRAIEGMGFVTNEELEKLKEHNPYLSGGAELVGAIAPAFLSGGLGALGTAARLAPAGMSAKAAAKAGQLVGTRLGLAETATVTGKMMKGGATLATEAGVEGLIAGSGYAVSEDVLGDSDLTAEEILANIGGLSALSAGIGGALGVGVGALSRTFSEISKKTTGSGLGKWAANAQDELTSAMGRGDIETVKRMRDPEYLDEIVFDIDNTISRGTQDATKVVEDVIQSIDDVSRLAKGSMKEEAVRAAVPDDTMVDAIAESTAFLDRVDTGLKQMIDARGEFNRGGLQDIREMTQRFKQELIDDLESKFGISIEDLSTLQMNKDVTAFVFHKLDSFKKNLGSKTYRELRNQQDFNTYGELKKIYDGAREFLEKENIFGQAAIMQKEVNLPFSQMLNLLPEFLKKFGSRYEKVAGQSKYVADPAKIKSFIKKLADETGEVKELTFRDMADRYKNFVDAVERNYGDVASTGAVRQNMDDVIGSWGELSQKLHDRSEYKKMLGATDWAWTVLGTSVGYGVGGPLGVMTGYAIDSLTRPGHALRKRAMIYHFKQGIKKQIDRGVSRSIKRMVDNAAPGAPRLKAGWLPKMITVLGVQSERGEKMDRKKQIAKTVQRLEEMSASGGLTAKVDEMAGELGEFPNLQEAASRKMGGAVPAVLALMPRTMAVHQDPITGEERVLMTDADADSAEQVLEGWEQPIAAISDGLASGNLTKLTVRTVKTLYPSIYSKARQAYIEGFQKRGESVSEQDAIMLSILWDIPLTPSMIPQYSMMMQNSFMPDEEGPRPETNVNSLRKHPNRVILPSQGPMQTGPGDQIV